jgi:proline iminopeptidase
MTTSNTAVELYPEIEPYAVNKLKVSDLHTIVYEEAGNPDGQPALFLHGGPGVGILPDYRRFFDPDFYRVILLDQRGSGRSTPHADIRENTTADIVADLETLRQHLGISDWLVMGGSWGSLLGVVYAIAHPQSVTGLIIRGVFLGRPFEIDWLHCGGGAAEIFPDEWEQYRAPVCDKPVADTVAAYVDLLASEDDDVARAAAASWTRWEASSMTLVSDPEKLEKLISSPAALSIARIESYYTDNGFFLDGDNYVLDNAHKIAHIPCRIVQGRYDIICPMISAWDLHKALPNSVLRIVADGSHSPMSPGMIEELVQASEDFKSLATPSTR